MSQFDALTPDALRARGSMKWSRYGADVLPMWVAEMDFPMAPPVKAAVQRALDADAVGYAQIDQRAPEAFSAFATRRLGMTIEPAWTTVVPHVLVGIEVALDVVTPPGAGIVVTTPAYMHFLVIPGLIGRPCVEVPLLENPAEQEVSGRWTLDLAGIERAFQEGARTLILCQPYNPVGKVFSRDELAALAEIVERYDGWVVSDEIHAPLTMPGVQHVGYSTVSEAAASHCVTVSSASKSFSMPGLPCATVSLHTAEGAAMFAAEAPADHLYGATSLGVAANVAAWTEGDEWLDAVREQVAANSARLAEAVQRMPGVRYLPMEATYLAWLDFRDAGLPDDPATWLLEHAKVAMNSGPDFGAPGAGFCRMNLACSPELLDEALERIETALAAR